MISPRQPAIGLLTLSLCFASSCKNFEIPLTTPEPIKIDPIDVKIRLDVYQHGEGGDASGRKDQELEDANLRTTNRTGEVQKLKDDRIIGENHRGLLSIRNVPEDAKYAVYARQIVEAENKDRLLLMRDHARQRGVMLHDIEGEQSADKVRSAIPGEWIEVPGEKDGEFQWVQKKGAPGS